MRSTGNSSPDVCASNLLRIVRGEVPYDRVRGRDGRLIDQPNVTDEAQADAEWLLETYEPRVTVDNVEVMASNAANGDFYTMANITRKEGEK